MELNSDFSTFVQAIRLTDHQLTDLRDGHVLLRQRLAETEDLAPIRVSDFLQGSYRRHTAVRPKGDTRADVDVIVVTRLHESEYAPGPAMDLFVPFLKKHYEGKWQRQGRSFGIELSAVDFDLVITSAPSESEIGILQSDAVMTDDDIVKAADWRLHTAWLSLENRAVRKDAKVHLAEAKAQPEWQADPLRIPDRQGNTWQDTHPLEQIRWTRDKTQRTSGHFVNVVKAVKWWRLANFDRPQHPKGFPLERIVGDCCPDDIGSVAEGIVRTFETITSRYQPLAAAGSRPRLPDYGVPGHDVLERLSASDFLMFCQQVKDGAALARRAYDTQDTAESGNLWRELLGDKFPAPKDNGGHGKRGYSRPSEPAVPGSGRFAR